MNEENNVYGVFNTETKLELVVEPNGSRRWVNNYSQPVIGAGERVEIHHENRPTRFATRVEAEELAERIGAECVVSVCPRIYLTANITEPAERVVVRG